MREINVDLLRESITFAAIGSLVEGITGKPAEELLSPETIAQIDAIMAAHEPFDSLESLAELLTLLDESAARLLAHVPEGGGGNRKTDEETRAS